MTSKFFNNVVFPDLGGPKMYSFFKSPLVIIGVGTAISGDII